ncbi:MAG: hypothetical protein LBU37_01605 [Tannerellaceae bacterium]|jgi:antitoxin (DNA-binding transcriptional repressor) of toxin-antitoxin stability system|nr:hypothetical protein [Tannerellaceae bacterium]
MNALSIRDFRSKMAAFFDKSDAGEQVVIRRGGKLYAIVPISSEELIITPELQAKIDQARQDYKDGKFVSCSTKEQLHTFLDAL